MDISRPDLKRQKRRRNFLYAASFIAVIAVVGFLILRLKPAIPTVDGPVWTDVVKRGALLRQVRGPGTLVPREDRIRLIPAETEATVIRIRVLPGAKVEPDTILMDLVDPEVQQEMLDAGLQLKAAEADLLNVKARLRSDLMTQQAGAATVSADQKQAALQSQTDKSLYDLGVISGLTYSASKGKADELSQRNDIEHQRYDLNEKAIATQVAVQQTKVAQAQAMLGLRQKQQAALSVRAGIAGVLVDLPHQVGEHVAIGTTLAKVVQPDQLKASLKIPETQARDIQIGQPSEIDTHNGVILGKVMRIDPAVQNGTVTVDVELAGALPQGARPDLSVDGTIDLDRLSDVLYIGRPAVGNENSTISLFRVDADGKTATRVSVKVGRASVNSMEVLSGLNAGDSVILSDMSKWDSTDRVRLQ
ncbi:efflux RND transporter periplasmic adaptor subunit [Granulicella tundricola]|uniref:Efflux transporter, RND family, MFP subunit n=1 Tax=Granulicella tundricola (strain ATCC BAA-1859 / DSM 23138 / MP5ACTX9) TaxID=1198114 RepID=E8WY95_GRATM|nr:efflux RND transporter periplasmic adaptor subunit [Granulicella tundricola]ADW68722.1 efflux transporter, RND family, MFP subunit [Granulicella tundricola MP5ACTX9]